MKIINKFEALFLVATLLICTATYSNAAAPQIDQFSNEVANYLHAAENADMSFEDSIAVSLISRFSI